jgi:hypothetical protein
MGPLSIKEARENAKMIAAEVRKDIELQQKLKHKEQQQLMKLTGKAPTQVEVLMMQQPMNPEAGPKDTVPAMLTPGEAVIPEPAAQHPKNKALIEALVNEGRKANRGLSDGAIDVPRKGYQAGTTRVPFDDSLIGHMIMKESSGYHRDPKTGQLITSPLANDPAKGILQWRESSAAQPGFGVTPFDVNTADEHTQINATRDYMTALTNKYGGDAQKALAAYNWGTGNMDRHLARSKGDWKQGLPKETAGYLSIYDDYQRGLNPEGRVTEDDLSTLQQLAVPAPTGTTRETPSAANWQVEPVKGQGTRSDIVENVPRGRTPEATRALGGAATVPEMQAALPPVSEVPVPQVTPAEGAALGEREDWVKSLSEDEQKTIAMAAGTLEHDPEKVQVLDAAVKKVQETNDPSFLEKAVKSIWGGKNSLFSERELARFAVTFVGGLLTGGSVGGSLRWSAVDALKAGEARQTAAAASEAEAAKNIRERNEKLEGDLATSLKDTNIPEDIRKEYFKELQNLPQEPAARAAALQRMVQAVNTYANASKTGGAANVKEGRITNSLGQQVSVQYYETPTGQRMVSTDGKNWMQAPGRVTDMGEWRQNRTDVRNASKARLTDTILSANKHIKEYSKGSAETTSERLAEEMLDILDDVGLTSTPSATSKIIELSAASLYEDAPKGKEPYRPSGEALRRAVYGNAIIEMRPTNSSLYRTKDGLPPSEYRQAIGNTAKELMDAQRRAGKSDFTLDMAVKSLEDQWKEFSANDANKKGITEYKAIADAKKTTPFLLWVQQGMASKPTK